MKKQAVVTAASIGAFVLLGGGVWAASAAIQNPAPKPETVQISDFTPEPTPTETTTPTPTPEPVVAPPAPAPVVEAPAPEPEPVYEGVSGRQVPWIPSDDPQNAAGGSWDMSVCEGGSASTGADGVPYCD